MLKQNVPIKVFNHKPASVLPELHLVVHWIPMYMFWHLLLYVCAWVHSVCLFLLWFMEVHYQQAAGVFPGACIFQSFLRFTVNKCHHLATIPSSFHCLLSIRAICLLTQCECIRWPTCLNVLKVLKLYVCKASWWLSWSDAGVTVCCHKRVLTKECKLLDLCHVWIPQRNWINQSMKQLQ